MEVLSTICVVASLLHQSSIDQLIFMKVEGRNQYEWTFTKSSHHPNDYNIPISLDLKSPCDLVV
mgnify:FL=1